MCTSNAFGVETCNHGYDTLDRHILLAIIWRGADRKRGLTVADLSSVIGKTIIGKGSNNTPFTSHRLLRNRLTVLTDQGFLARGSAKPFGRSWLLGWVPTDKCLEQYIALKSA